jgi:hypothetical protein
MIDLNHTLVIKQLAGPEGPSLYFDGLRVAGPKRVGGEETLAQWTTTSRAVLAALAGTPTRAALAKLDPSGILEIDIADGRIRISRRLLKAEMLKLSAPPSVTWIARRIDILASLEPSILPARVSVTVAENLSAQQKQERRSEWDLALDRLFAR